MLAAIPGSLDFLGRNEEIKLAVRDVCFKRNPFLLAEDEYRTKVVALRRPGMKGSAGFLPKELCLMLKGDKS